MRPLGYVESWVMRREWLIFIIKRGEREGGERKRERGQEEGREEEKDRWGKEGKDE